MRLQLRTSQAVGLLAAATMVGALLTSSLLLWSLRERELAHARAETVSLATMFLEETRQSMQGADKVLQGVQERLGSGFGSTIALDSDMTQLLLATRVSGMRQLHALSLVDAKGRVVNASVQVPAAERDVSAQAFFKAFSGQKREGFFLDKPRRDVRSRLWLVRLARRIDQADGSFRGVVVADIDASRIEALFMQARLDYLRPIALYQGDGTLMASYPHRENDLGAPALELQGHTLPTLEQGVRSLTHRSGDDSHHQFALGRVADFDLLIGVTDDESQSLAAWREIAVPIALAVLVLCLFTVFVASFLSQKLRRKELLETALLEARTRYQHTVESVKDAIVAVDTAMRIQIFNPAAQAMFGYSAQEALGQSLTILLPERSRLRHDQQMGAFAQTTEGPRTMAAQLEIYGRRRDGSEFPIESSISKTDIGGQLQMTAVLRDVTAQRRARNELTAMNQELRALYAAQQSVREEERARIARELHDDLGQQMTGLKLSLAWLGNRIKEGRGADADSVEGMRRMLDTAITSVRRISSELRPQILDELGFGDAVTWQIREFAKHSGLQLAIHLPAQDRVHDAALATALFRIVQEALNNVVRHAGAKNLWVELVCEAEDLVLRVRDDGVGIASTSGHAGMGLSSMRERAHAAGARLRVISAPGEGCCVEVRIALAQLPTLRQLDRGKEQDT